MPGSCGRAWPSPGLAPLAGLAGLVLILAALIVVETTRHAQTRRSLRNTQPGERRER
jgi:hypothetical protein